VIEQSDEYTVWVDVLTRKADTGSGTSIGGEFRPMEGVKFLGSRGHIVGLGEASAIAVRWILFVSWGSLQIP
jgi:hypothetical protein